MIRIVLILKALLRFSGAGSPSVYHFDGAFFNKVLNINVDKAAEMNKALAIAPKSRI